MVLSSHKAGQSLEKRIGLSLQYDGSGFCGWQRQKQGESVQGCIEKAISELDPYRPIKVIAAGRTDSVAFMLQVRLCTLIALGIFLQIAGRLL